MFVTMPPLPTNPSRTGKRIIITEKLRLVSPFLLGIRSHLYGEANDGSDMDFYIICPWRAFFYYSQHKELATEIKIKYPQINTMLVPKWFFKKGLVLYLWPGFIR